MPFTAEIDDINNVTADFMRRTGLTIMGAAEALGTHRNTISNYLHGRSVPDKTVKLAMKAIILNETEYEGEDCAAT